jgi:glycosyltransferase involved in cell wall biosynthesis
MKIAILAIDAREYRRDYQTPQPYFGTAVQALLQGMPALAGHEIHVVSCLRQPVAHTPKLAENVFYHSLLVPRIGWVKTLYSGCVRASRRKLHELQPDIVHAQGTERDCGLSAVRSGFPNLITIHGNMRAVAKALRAPLISFMTLQSILESWTIRRTGGVLCLTNYARNEVADRTGRTWVLPNAVNESYFAVQRSTEITRDILCIGTIDRRKNQNFLIRALEPLVAEHQFRLVFLGSGTNGDPYLDEFKSLVATRPWCVDAGFKSTNEIKNYLSTAASLITPSLEENCPMVILEAMAVGVPVAAANAGGIPDLITDGANGVMFDPQNADSIRAATRKFLMDPPFAQAMAAAGRKRARERHHPQVIARQHLEIYQDLLAKKTASH